MEEYFAFRQGKNTRNEGVYIYKPPIEHVFNAA
jgi:hypothetical protein